MSRIADLATFARKFHVSVADAVVLPVLFDNAAAKVGMTAGQLLTECIYRNAPLGRYLAECAAKAGTNFRNGE